VCRLVQDSHHGDRPPTLGLQAVQPGDGQQRE
jgi:hypothetical protein